MTRGKSQMELKIELSGIGARSYRDSRLASGRC